MAARDAPEQLFVAMTGVETVTTPQEQSVDRRLVEERAVSEYLDAMGRDDGLDDAIAAPDVE